MQDMGFLDDHAELFLGRHVHFAGTKIHLSFGRHNTPNTSLDRGFCLYPPHPAQPIKSV